MEPPTYEEASRHPPNAEGFSFTPPPAYDTSFSLPSTPPPTYGEAVTVQTDPFPVLTPPSGLAAVTSPPRRAGVTTVHPTTQVGVTAPVSRGQPQSVVVTQPGPIAVTCLRDTSGYVCCPHCHHLVNSEVTYSPGKSAWCLCILLMMMGLVCGFCLIPLMVRGLQDAHHTCPRCEKPLHVYVR
ncbi:lipopolysaccharide-induced tumor necrosis factor-alpha factor [Mugil cephalus]|uniref:lipopolysaccharide-induced tumor necrosis factor-alpha factor n=1 Tax=Mugil cephalus TaxID=48193 RepID=UPI001FB5EEB1|nr:lipopolysaccharide-induced tumor necrosis factor-alpha factor [Mugil cephalus]XP_047432939.1 lipopolysaccharide-induced tumor necrosis factor-alpha factor [Mugil cephalus]